MPVVTYIAKSIPVSICCSRVGMHIHAEGGRGAGNGEPGGVEAGGVGKGEGGVGVLHVTPYMFGKSPFCIRSESKSIRVNYVTAVWRWGGMVIMLTNTVGEFNASLISI